MFDAAPIWDCAMGARSEPQPVPRVRRGRPRQTSIPTPCPLNFEAVAAWTAEQDPKSRPALRERVVQFVREHGLGKREAAILQLLSERMFWRDGYVCGLSRSDIARAVAMDKADARKTLLRLEQVRGAIVRCEVDPKEFGRVNCQRYAIAAWMPAEMVGGKLGVANSELGVIKSDLGADIAPKPGVANSIRPEPGAGNSTPRGERLPFRRRPLPDGLAKLPAFAPLFGRSDLGVVNSQSGGAKCVLAPGAVSELGAIYPPGSRGETPPSLKGHCVSTRERDSSTSLRSVSESTRDHEIAGEPVEVIEGVFELVDDASAVPDPAAQPAEPAGAETFALTAPDAKPSRRKRSKSTAVAVARPFDALTADAVTAVSEWNALAGELGLEPVTPEALAKHDARALGARLREHGLEGWRRVLAEIRQSDFLQGQRGDWVVTFAWAAKRENFGKITSGQYRNKPAAQTPARRPAASPAAPAPAAPQTATDRLVDAWMNLKGEFQENRATVERQLRDRLGDCGASDDELAAIERSMIDAGLTKRPPAAVVIDNLQEFARQRHRAAAAKAEHAAAAAGLAALERQVAEIIAQAPAMLRAIANFEGDVESNLERFIAQAPVLSEPAIEAEHWRILVGAECDRLAKWADDPETIGDVRDRLEKYVSKPRARLSALASSAALMSPEFDWTTQPAQAQRPHHD